jgi:xylulokinase
MAGSSVLSWFRGVCFEEEPGGAETYRQLESLASGVPAGCDGLLFHPYLFGERSPFYNPNAGGAFLGLRHWHGKGHLARSIMEGVALAIANCVDAVQEIARQRQEQVMVFRTGRSGGSQLPAWRQIITDSLDHALEIVDVDEPGCLGAALLAGTGIGAYKDLASAIRQTVRVGVRSSPDAASAALYRERRALFNETYEALEPRLYQANLKQAKT